MPYTLNESGEGVVGRGGQSDYGDAKFCGGLIGWGGVGRELVKMSTDNYNIM